MNLFQKLLARQLGQNYIDRTVRGRGNRAARRAIKTSRGSDHLLFENEETYTERPAILQRGSLLLIIDRFPEARELMRKRNIS